MEYFLASHLVIWNVISKNTDTRIKIDQINQERRTMKISFKVIKMKRYRNAASITPDWANKISIRSNHIAKKKKYISLWYVNNRRKKKAKMKKGKKRSNKEREVLLQSSKNISSFFFFLVTERKYLKWNDQIRDV